MNRNFLICMLALVVGMTACKDDLANLPSDSKGTNITVTATQNGGTRTSLGSYVTWASGDSIRLYTSLGDSAILRISGGEGTDVAHFSGTLTNTAAAPGRKIFGIYTAQHQCPKGYASSYYMYWNYYWASGPAPAEDKFHVEFSVPEIQIQDVSDPTSCGKYTMMVATPSLCEGDITNGNIPLTFNQLCTIMDFRLNNIPAGYSVSRVAVKAATPGDLVFNVRGYCNISLPNTSADFLKLYPLNFKPVATGGNLGASYSDLLFVKTSNVTEGSTASIVTLPVDYSSNPKDLKIVVTVVNSITGVTNDLIFDKNGVTTNFQRGKRYLTTLNLSAPSSTETVLFRDDFQWISAPMTYVNFFDNPRLGLEFGMGSWSPEDLNQGWTSGTGSNYQRSAGYLKLGKTSYGGEMISPALNTKTGLVHSYPSVKVRVRMCGYMNSTGSPDQPGYVVSIPSGGGTLVEAASNTFTNFNQLKTFEFNVLNFTPFSRIAFTSGLGLGKVSQSNRFFFDDFEITTTSSPIVE